MKTSQYVFSAPGAAGRKPGQDLYIYIYIFFYNLLYIYSIFI